MNFKSPQNATLQTHYQTLLGLVEPWRVDSVDLDIINNKVDIHISHAEGVRVTCPECGESCRLADHAPLRRWRHLDTMQCVTTLLASTPRADCAQCGVKTIQVPWAGKNSRYTLLFEAFAVMVLQRCKTVKDAAAMLSINWTTAHAIMEKAVNRGMERRSDEVIEHVGLDEKNFGKGHSYVSVMCDLDQSRVLEVVPGRDVNAANTLWETMGPEQRKGVKAVCMDMWPAYMTSTNQHVEQADIVHDRFHISQHLGKAVDLVRREEHRKLSAQGDERMKGSKYLWLRCFEHVDEEQQSGFAELRQVAEKTARAWSIKELFREFWDYSYAANARKFFERWYEWASRCQLRPVVKVAHMIRGHFENIATYFNHRITNAVSEGMNSKIQSLKSAARGFRSFESYRIRILFFCGKLDLSPLKNS